MGKARKDKVFVEIQEAIVSPDWAYHKSQVVELDADLAEKWIGSGIAKPFKGEQRIEKALAGPEEKEVIR